MRRAAIFVAGLVLIFAVVWCWRGGVRGVGPEGPRARPAPERVLTVSRPPPAGPVELVATPLAGELHAPAFGEERDLAALRGLIGLLTTSLRLAERPPLGDNADIAAALTGSNRRRIAFLPLDHVALRGGLLVDRRGTPYHFHARSAELIDVRAAGADRVLFTADDLVSGP